MIALLTLLAVLLVSLIVTRVATIALAATGLSRPAARFQARSAFTGVGFTTNEAENVVGHPVRRRVIATLMLLGNAGIATAVATLIFTFAGAEGEGSLVTRSLLLLAGLVTIFLLASNRWVDRHSSRLIARLLDRYTELEIRDYASLLELGGDYRISELAVREDDWISGRTLAQLALRDEGVIVLGIRRGDGTYLGAPDGTTVPRPGDTLMLYGADETLADLDERRRGTGGELRHVDRVVEHRRRREEERAAEDEDDDGPADDDVARA